MLLSISDVIDFLPVGIFFAIGIPSLVSGIVQTEWLNWPLLDRPGSRLRKLVAGLAFIALGFGFLYAKRAALAAKFISSSIGIALGLLFVLGPAYFNQRRSIG
jgi:hypothetical protein